MGRPMGCPMGPQTVELYTPTWVGQIYTCYTTAIKNTSQSTLVWVKHGNILGWLNKVKQIRNDFWLNMHKHKF